jgi:hypothetical protein
MGPNHATQYSACLVPTIIQSIIMTYQSNIWPMTPRLLNCESKVNAVLSHAAHYGSGSQVDAVECMNWFHTVTGQMTTDMAECLANTGDLNARKLKSLMGFCVNQYSRTTYIDQQLQERMMAQMEGFECLVLLEQVAPTYLFPLFSGPAAGSESDGTNADGQRQRQCVANGGTLCQRE